MADPTTGERLAVIESENKAQSKVIDKIFKQVETTGKHIVETKTKIDILTKADLITRVTKVETRQKIYLSIAGTLITLSGGLMMWKDKFLSFF